MKKTLLIFLSAVIIGSGLAFYIFNYSFGKKDLKVEGKSSAYAFQIGAFSKYENAKRVADRNNGIVITDNDIFRVYVALLSNKKAITKLSDYYKKIGLNYYLKDILVSDSFLEEINTYEEMLIKSNSDTYSTINIDVLNKYKESL